ncbi:MAG: hypothetical protein AB1599_08935 [Planctomycetota bacterium]
MNKDERNHKIIGVGTEEHCILLDEAQIALRTLTDSQNENLERVNTLKTSRFKRGCVLISARNHYVSADSLIKAVDFTD